MSIENDIRHPPSIRLDPWGREDLELLRKCVGDPAKMEHLGGLESDEKIAEGQSRYESKGSNQFKILDEASGTGIGWVGFWKRTWPGTEVHEIGRSVIPAFRAAGSPEPRGAS